MPNLSYFGLILIIALIGAVTARKFNQPLIVGYLLAGVISRALLSSFPIHSSIESLAEIGVALLLFSLGLEFSFARLSRVKLIAGVGATAQILTVILITLILLSVFGIPPSQALFIGAAFSLSSTAVVARILESKGQIDTWPGEIAIGWLLVQDLAVLPLVVLLPVLSSESGLSFTTFLVLLKAGLLLCLALVIGQRVVPAVVRFFTRYNSRELLLLAVVALMFSFALLTTRLGLGLAMGAFLAGLLMSSSSAHLAIFAEVRPLREIFSILFFVSLGLMVSPSVLILKFPLLISAAALVMIGKFLIVWLILTLFSQHSRVKFTTAAYLTQIGEFGFVLMQIGQQSGVADSQLVSFIAGVALITIMATPWLVRQVDAIYHLFIDRLSLSPSGKNHHRRSSHSLKLQNHLIICGYGRVGKWLGRALELFRLPFVVIEYNRQIYSDLRQRQIPAIYGDSADIEILINAGIKSARTLVITTPDLFTQQLIIDHCHQLNPKLPIISRVHHEDDQQQLKHQGAHQVVQPEFEAALSLTSKILQSYGKSAGEISNKFKRLRLEHGRTR
jgi:CPA2 family monovalent cation:H+ antiporter-2